MILTTKKQPSWTLLVAGVIHNPIWHQPSSNWSIAARCHIAVPRSRMQVHPWHRHRPACGRCLQSTSRGPGNKQWRDESNLYWFARTAWIYSWQIRRDRCECSVPGYAFQIHFNVMLHGTIVYLVLSSLSPYSWHRSRDQSARFMFEREREVDCSRPAKRRYQHSSQRRNWWPRAS